MAKESAAASKITWFIAVPLVCLCLAPGIASATHEGCGDCHSREAELKIADVTSLCLSCHTANRNDHKTGVAPDNRKSTLPLDRGGKISCITCHDPHGKAALPRLLRMKKDDLCLDCHDK
jgi:predicted CXXCH cytochrome family protein